MNSIDILVPNLPESIIDATVVVWHKKVGDHVQRDEVLVEIETDKVILEIPAPIEGVLENILMQEGAIVTAKQILGILKIQDKINQTADKKINNDQSNQDENYNLHKSKHNDDILTPSVRRLINKYDLDIQKIHGSGVKGRLTSEDVKKYIESEKVILPISDPDTKDHDNSSSSIERNIRRVPMTRLRKRIAERMLEAKNNMASLTTFNEVNMQPVMNLRKKYGEIFEKRHGIRLGLMSFYVKAVLEALKRFPGVNAAIDGDDIIYYNYFDISIAISTPRGLVTPVLKDVNLLSMVDIENKIKELSIKGRDGKLKMEDLTGGNFTITNGGIFGSLMSTPIINPPQSAILGMHVIKERAIVVNSQIVILPMMYLALSYDHRLIDGKESVNFLMTIKNILEDPILLLLNL